MRYYALLFFTLVFGGILNSCSSSKQLPEELEDTYYGFLPCADCPGISFILELNDDRFRRTMNYYDRDVTSVTEGKIRYNDGEIQLFEDGNLTGHYAVEEENLIQLDGEGNRITGELAPYYILYPGDTTRAQMLTTWGQEDNAHRYKGTGNEPFWMVQVKARTLYFKGLLEQELEFEIPISQSNHSENGNSIRYYGESDGIELTVQITHETCQDNMSGYYFPTLLEVDLLTPEIEKQTLRGCGEFLGRYQLNGNWILYRVDGREFNSEAPTMSVSLGDGKISGNAGCNRYFASIQSISDTTIGLFNVGSTKMACPDMKLETLFLNMLDQSDISWSIDQDGQLILTTGTGSFTFRRDG